MGRPRESPNKKCRFQNLILEDEEECQIKVVMYADEIEQYVDKLKLINTYLISTAIVKVSPTSYGKPIHKFYWILDKEIVIEHIKLSNELEKQLPPPTKLNITTFDCIPHLMVDSAAKIGKISFSSLYGRISDKIEGHEIASKIATEADLIVILGKSIGISTYQEKTSTSSSVAPMIVTPAGQQVISIAEISSAPAMGAFYVEAKMAILDEFQEFCVLECSGCKQKKRTKDRNDFECPKCNRKTTLVPRYYTFDL
ncbi:hypothetical protein H5410_026556 [Solanum commersonii]|uniref:Replication factor A C-terminal domain-containing protein n=1 Tax=Solanum commersonii TaxID=4109 RepID=A0A9J5YZ66_SOLCO|nr:hypothetical protein H5410_026556 [Solanum commersonii]